MQINISYTLYTDGDYSLRNAEDFVVLIET